MIHHKSSVRIFQINHSSEQVCADHEIQDVVKLTKARKSDEMCYFFTFSQNRLFGVKLIQFAPKGTFVTASKKKTEGELGVSTFPVFFPLSTSRVYLVAIHFSVIHSISMRLLCLITFACAYLRTIIYSFNQRNGTQQCAA